MILTTQGYAYREVGRILLVDEESVSEWVARYRATGLDGLRNHPRWGGEHRQRLLSAERLEELKQTLAEEAMAGSKVGSGWTAKAIRKLIRERYGVSYSKSGGRKLLCELWWSYQRGRKLYIRRRLAEQARFVSDTEEVLAKDAESGATVVPLAGDQSKVYLEATLARRWNPRRQQPLVADAARHKQAENIYGAIHLGTGEETATFCIDWQDSDATIAWLEMMMGERPEGQSLLWSDGASHHTSEEVEEWLEEHPRLTVIHFAAYAPEENPKEATSKALKEEVSHHCRHETMAELKTAINGYYRTARRHTVNFLERFGYRWSAGRLDALSG